MKQLKFSKNWNNKLCCPVFTTIRLHNESRKTGELYEIYLLEKKICHAILVDLYTFTYSNIPELVCYTDTGVNKLATQHILSAMYPEIIYKDLQTKLDVLVMQVIKNKSLF